MPQEDTTNQNTTTPPPEQVVGASPVGNQFIDTAINMAEQDRTKVVDLINSKFAPLISEAEKGVAEAKTQGEAMIGGTQRSAGRFRGLGLSSAGLAILENTKVNAEKIYVEAQKRVDDLKVQLTNALITGDLQASSRIQELYLKAEDQKNTAFEQKLKINQGYINLMEESRKQALAPYELSSAKQAAEGIDVLRTKYTDAGILPTDTAQQAYQKVLNSPSYKLATEQDKANLAKTYADIRKTELETTLKSSVGSTRASDFADLISITSDFVPTANGERDSFTNQITNYISSGNYSTALTKIQNAAIDKLPAEQKNKVANASTDLGILEDLQRAIDDYKKHGGDTGLLRGSAQDIENNLAGVTTNPELSALATQLRTFFVRYRNDFTGAAFGVKENKDYEKITPSEKKSFDLNSSIITGAKSALESLVNASYGSRLGDGYKNLKSLVTLYNTSDDVNKVKVADYVKSLSGDNKKTAVNTVTSILNRGGNYADALRAIYQ